MLRTGVPVLCLLLAAAGAPEAQKPTDIVRWSATPKAISVTAEGTAKVTLAAEVEDGWHLYALTQPKDGPPPLRIGATASQPFEVKTAAIEAPPPQIAEDPNFNTETHFYEGRVAFVVPVAARKSAAAGAHKLSIDVTFQVCSNRLCLRPFTQTLVIDATIRNSSKGYPR